MTVVTTLQVWAPSADRVRAQFDGHAHDMAPLADGWWELPAGPLRAGMDYGFLLDDADELVPDPRSRWQPQGVHGPSRIYDQSAFDWTDGDWRGRGLDSAVLYEMHIGTFTPGATFDSAIERLDHLVQLGITHVELLPVNSFNGVWNWGYDGVDWYAVHETYGGPDGLKRFVDAAHARGLAVILDVVYNHLGPSGNYLPRFGPYLKQGRNTWGDLLNLELPPVRQFILDNALMWLRDFHIDGLRLDAVHALVDTSPVHILRELADEAHALSIALGKPLPLIAESDLNDVELMCGEPPSGYGLDGQWDDDVHHALHALLTGERQGYYDDFGSLECLAKVMTSAFFHDGTHSTFRGRDHGAPVDRAAVPGWRFVVCLQNHDQVGNRAAGDRLSHLVSTERLKISAMLLLTSPFTPMLWMGEEWAASTPWPFFTSHPEPALALATARGRIEEFARHGWDPDSVVDPQDPQAYHGAVLDWDERRSGVHAEMLEFYKRLIRLRKENPSLSDPRFDRVDVEYDEDERTFVMRRQSVAVLVNLSATEVGFPIHSIEVLLSTAPVSDADGVLTVPATAAAIVRLGE